MSIALLDRLMRHMEWADAKAWSSVLAFDEGRTHGRVRELLHHGHAVQWAYLQIWRSEPLHYEELETFPDLASIMDWGRRFHAEARSFLARLDDVELDRPVEFPWRDMLARTYGSARPTDLLDSLLQVPAHSTYHRGQIAMHVRQLGSEPALTDYIVWCWQGGPGAAWDVD